MECFVLLIIFGFILAIFVMARGTQGLHSGGRAYHALAQRFRGTVQGIGIGRRPVVRFRYGPTWVRIAGGAKQGAYPITEAKLDWPDKSLNLRIEPRNASVLETDSSPARSFASDADEFDRYFQFSGDPKRSVRTLLSDGVRWQIHKLHRFGDGPLADITIRAGALLIRKRAALRRSHDLEDFAQLCLELFDQAMLTQSEGIEFVGGADEAQPIDDPICQVCGEPIVQEMVFCLRCRTPHHLDCWQYTGCCSTYGCSEQRYAVPTVARPVDKSDDIVILPDDDSTTERRSD